MTDETLDAITALYNTYPTTKNVDYSAFMRDFQPVESYPNYFVIHPVLKNIAIYKK